jgi:hypothetical protein
MKARAAWCTMYDMTCWCASRSSPMSMSRAPIGMWESRGSTLPTSPPTGLSAASGAVVLPPQAADLASCLSRHFEVAAGVDARTVDANKSAKASGDHPLAQLLAPEDTPSDLAPDLLEAGRTDDSQPLNLAVQAGCGRQCFCASCEANSSHWAGPDGVQHGRGTSDQAAARFTHGAGLGKHHGGTATVVDDGAGASGIVDGVRGTARLREFDCVG